MGGQKLDTLVDFPLEGLDLAPYVLSKNQKAKGPLIYDLFAVSNHYGSVGFGHYTAFGKNPHTNQWLNFDDSSCSPVSTSGLGRKEIVSNAAYSLFYRLRDHINLDNINFE
jgi:ubiquitin carboxyl-terminal hydrolase 4/11/15